MKRWKIRENLKESPVHIVYGKLPKDGNELRNMTFIEMPLKGIGGRTWFRCMEIPLEFYAYKYQMIEY